MPAGKGVAKEEKVEKGGRNKSTVAVGRLILTTHELLQLPRHLGPCLQRPADTRAWRWRPPPIPTARVVLLHRPVNNEQTGRGKREIRFVRAVRVSIRRSCIMAVLNYDV